jgi:hypothetical protein
MYHVQLVMSASDKRKATPVPPAAACPCLRWPVPACASGHLSQASAAGLGLHGAASAGGTCNDIKKLLHARIRSLARAADTMQLLCSVHAAQHE